MKWQILGYWGGYPKEGGATTGYLVTTDDGNILIDCGSGIMSKLTAQHKTVEDLTGVVISHLHDDHCADLGVLQYAAFGAYRNHRMSRKLDVYCPNEPAENWSHLQSDHVVMNAITVESIIELAGATIEFHYVKHTIPCYAIKLTYKGKVIVFTADTEYIESLVDFSKGADLLVCEATICQGSVHSVGKGHMDANQAGTLAKKADVKQLVLTHLPHDGDFSLMKDQASGAFGKTVNLAFEKDIYTV